MQRLRKKFDNHMEKVRKANNTSGKRKADPKATHAFSHFLLGGQLTGLLLFEDEEKEAIMKVAGKAIGRYQPTKKAAWAALTDKQREDYESRAHAMTMDVAQNQKMLKLALWDLLDNLTRSGRFGDMELLLFFAWREPGLRLITGK